MLSKQQKRRSSAAESIQYSLPLFDSALSISPEDVVARVETVNGIGRAVCLLAMNNTKGFRDLPLRKQFDAAGIVEAAYDDTIEAVFPEISKGIELGNGHAVDLMKILSRRPKRTLKKIIEASPDTRLFNYGEDGYDVSGIPIEAGGCPMHSHASFENAALHATAIATHAHESGLKEHSRSRFVELCVHYLLKTDTEKQGI